jgi:hypothetical protein
MERKVTALFLVLFVATVTRKKSRSFAPGLKDPSFSGQSLYAAVHVALWLYRLLEQADFWLSVKKKNEVSSPSVACRAFG